LLSAQKIEKTNGAQVRIYVVAAPKYAVEVLAEDYKAAEKILQEAAETATKAIIHDGGTGSFQRGK
jgi:translation initiation factor 2 alpha subunit (eIF-2alpha)